MVTAKDVALAIIGKTGTAGGNGYAIEFAGSAIRGLAMEGRMTLCNMAIEAGARAGMVAVDDTTINYIKGRPSRLKQINGMPPWLIGAPCNPMRALNLIWWCACKPKTLNRKSLGDVA